MATPSWYSYEVRKEQWIRQNPNATPEQYQKAIRRILKELKL